MKKVINITLTPENIRQQVINYKQLMEETPNNLLVNSEEVGQEIDKYNQYVKDIGYVNRYISHYNTKTMTLNDLINRIQYLPSLQYNEYKSQFETLIDEVSSNQSLSEEAEQILQRMERM